MSEKGLLSKSIANNISEAIIDKLGGTGYAPTEWSKNINLLGIASADIEEALASITEDASSSDKGLLSLSIASDVGAMLNKKYNTSRGFKPSEVSSAVSALTPLPEKTASSAPFCTFNDGADDVPTKSLVVTISPTLSGVSEVSETQTGRNIMPNEKVQGASTRVNIGQTDDDYSLHLKAGTYTLSATSLVQMRAYYRTSTGGSNVLIWSTYDTSGSGTFTLSEDSDVRIWLYNGDGLSVSDIQTFQLEVGSTEHAYEPYNPTTYTASLGRTIYGGTADIVTGEGVETHQEIDLGSLTWVYASASNRFYANLNLVGIYTNFPTNANEIADITCADYETITFSSLSGDSSLNNKVAGVNTDAPFITIRDTRFSNANDFKNAVTGKKAVIPLATPTDFTFTGQEVPTRLGYNAFWSDEGDTEVTYRADLDLYEAPSMLLGANNTETEGNEEQEGNE